MPQHPSERRALTRVPIHPPIAERWSPRAFDPDAVLDAGQVTGLLEAARWAATWGGRQPVRFVVGLRRAEGGDGVFDAIAALLSRGNSYARQAGALILVCADEGEDDNTRRYSHVDAGAAAANLAVEAVSRGLVSHPMAGFDVDGARSAFGIPDTARPLMVIAVGTLADYGSVGEEVAERDRLPRRRLSLDEVVFGDAWGRSWDDLSPE